MFDLPEPQDIVTLHGRRMVCAETFRSMGTVFIRFIKERDAVEHFKHHRYVESTYLTSAELLEALR